MSGSRTAGILSTHSGKKMAEPHASGCSDCKRAFDNGMVNDRSKVSKLPLDILPT
jgi:hypothetical protein